MLKVKLTKNYAGVTISGDYNDLDHLYDSIYYLIHGEPISIGEYTMQNHLYGFLYDVRHAYQGDREVELIDNNLDKYKREYFNLKENEVTDKNLCFSFNYLLPDLLLDMVLIKYFINKVCKKENDIYNPHINMVNYFYSIVLYSLLEMLTKIKFNKVKKGLLESVVSDRIFFPQWFELITVDYAKMTKEKRQKEFMHIADAIYDYGHYKDYCDMKLDIQKLCEEKNCTLDDIHYDNFPEKIEW